MKSKRYCPNCGSFDIRRMKRTFLQKKVFRVSPKYHCVQCHEITHQKYLEQNEFAFQPSLNEIILENAAHSAQINNNQVNSTHINSNISNNTNSAVIEEISFKDCA